MKRAGLTQIAVITGAHGVRGQVVIRSTIDDANAIFSYQSLTDLSGRRQFKLTRTGVKEKSVIAAIDGITDRNQAELLKGTALYAPADSLPEKNDNEWYHRELIGLKARLPDGKIYGRVIGCHNFGAGDILELELPDGKNEMLPFKAPFVGEIHVEDGYLMVNPPEYLEARERS